MSTLVTIEIKLQNVSNAYGTKGWFKALIADSELVIRQTSIGIPGLFLHLKHKRNGVANKEYEGNYLLCQAATDSDYDTGRRVRRINGIKYVYPYAYAPKYGFNVSLFDYPLTPSCEKAVEEFINLAMKHFAAWYEVQ